MSHTLPSTAGISTHLSFPTIFKALSYCYYDSYFTDGRPERLSNSPKVTWQSHDLNSGCRSLMPRLCAQALLLNRSSWEMSPRGVNVFNRRKWERKGTGKKKEDGHSGSRLSILPVTFLCCSVTQSCPTLCDTVDCSSPGSLSMGVFRQEPWSGLLCPNPGIEAGSPALAGRLLPRSHQGSPSFSMCIHTRTHQTDANMHQKAWPENAVQRTKRKSPAFVPFKNCTEVMITRRKQHKDDKLPSQ